MGRGLCVRSDGNDGDQMFPWGHAPELSYAVGDTVYSGDIAGRVVSLDSEHGTIGIVWSDGDGGAITYPVDATYLRKAMPWE